ncbi:efflux RND transporter periplasmic adaptor subunit [Cerasicoccus maritimus]|uniref:efflux RND transporter periplasmic adaptor subunit n=1 Tax=Cerasicoccus maritimus TaxID=490089 RepID=UPI002852683C|nr:efflux RND transporter periplasmic adaptor subunit [Cerasicoccus maritimus]
MKGLLKVVLTLLAVVAAGALAWRFYQLYESHPWTRDGQVRAYVVGIAARVDGPIVNVYVRDNQWVDEGTPLFEIDPTDYEKAVRRAEAALEKSKTVAANLKLEVDRRRDLVSQKLISLETFQDFEARYLEAVADIAVDEAQLELARLNLSYTRVNAPVSGYITNLEVTTGSYVTTGQPLMALVDASSFWISAYFRETDLQTIKPGDRVRIVMMGDFFEPFHGEVESISWGIYREDGASNSTTQLPVVQPTVDWVRLAQRFPVRIKPLNLPEDIKLRVGQTVSVMIDPIAESDFESKKGYQSAGTTSYPKQLKDGRGAEVVIKKKPERVISLAPSTTQWMRCIGLESKLIGATKFCELSDAHQDIVRYDTYPAPNFEVVVGANADLIITADIMDPQHVAKLRAFGQTVLVLNNDGFEGILLDGALLGEAMDHAAEAQSIIADLEDERAAVVGAVAGRNTKPSVLLALSPTLEYVAGPRSYGDNLIQLAGAKNVAEGALSMWPQLSREAIIQANPDCIIVTQAMPEGEAKALADVTAILETDPFWQNLQAVKNGHIYVVDPQLLNVPGPQIGQALKAVHAAISESVQSAAVE